MTVPIDFLRGVANGFLPDVATIRRVTETATGDGTSTSWSAVATGVPCRVSPASRTASPEAMGGSGALQAVGQWAITLPAGTDVTVKDRIVVGARTFEVSEVLTRSYEAARIVNCREIT